MSQQQAGLDRYGKPFSIIMFDLDHFKQLNDTEGHLAGDQMLKAVADGVQKKIRETDILFRYGGEEFLLILPETRKARALVMADRIRRTIEQLTVEYEGRWLHITASFGVTAVTSNQSADEIIRQADERLYAAKKAGRNCVMPGVVLAGAVRDAG